MKPSTTQPTQVAPQPTQPASQPPLPAGLRLVMPVEPVGARLRSGTQTVASLNAELDDAKRRGAVGVRAVVDMQWMCGSATCDFAPLAPVVSGAGSRGLIVYLHVNSMPSWLDSRGRWYGPTGEIGRRWAALFAQLTGRFGTSVAGYEVWNEPNIVQYWHQGPSAAQYADLLRSVWQAVKPAQPDVQIIGGVLSNNDIGWMTKLDEELAKLGGTTQNRYYYDLLGVHPYTGNASSGYDPALAVGTHQVDISTGPKDMTFKGLARLRDQVATNEGIHRDVVVGEFGYTTFSGWYHVAEPQRSQYLRSAMGIAAGWSWLRGFTVYSLAQDNPDGFSVLGSESHDVLRVN